MSDLCPRRYIGVCRGGVSVSDLCRRNYIGVIAVIYISVCRGGVVWSGPEVVSS